ncbi:MAG: hypothetical protein JSR39_04015 [Verrucomicrobia bacterium]|nr:hypothetical protein [Verrucomicrobiota bacterium]
MIDKIRENIECLLRSKMVNVLCKQICCLLSIIFFLSGCEPITKEKPPVTLTEEERQWLGEFFNDLLFVEGGAYTLWGSKPVTEIVLYHYTEEEMQQIVDGLAEEDKNNCYVQETYDLPENWLKWEKIQNRIALKKHLLFRSHFDEDGKASFVYFVDILKTALVIESNYDLFQRAVGFDFHPLEIVLEMPNQESNFWIKVRAAKNAAQLWGILFGYGKTNSSAFYWKFFDCPEPCKEILESYPYKFSNPDPVGKVELSITNLNLPSFVSFEEPDQMMQYYEKVRDNIKKTYMGNNQLDVTLNKLSS